MAAFCLVLKPIMFSMQLKMRMTIGLPLIMTKFQIEDGGLVQGVTKIFMTFSTLVT